MKNKKVFTLIIVLVVIVLAATALIGSPVGLNLFKAHSHKEASDLRNGIMLDVARRYYSVDEIKQYIDILSNQDKSFLQLHLSDDQNVGIECKFLDQTKENASLKNGIYTNPKTNTRFLSYEQVMEILKYAKAKDVEVIPEIDIPSHMTGFFTLARLKFGDEYVNQFAKGKGNESGDIDIVEDEGIEFIHSIYEEYTNFFKDSRYFHMGCDEYSYRIDEKTDFINYMADYLIKKGFVVRMWNDPIQKDNIHLINKKIEVTYWNYFGAESATVPDLQERGFRVLLTNAYYLLFVPSLSNTNQSDLDYTVNDIKDNWNIGMWDNDNYTTIKNRKNLMGSFIAVWGEESQGVDSHTILNQTERMYNAMVSKNKQMDN